MSQNVHDIRWSKEIYQKSHEKLESRTDSRRKKLNCGENPERYLPGRCAITITICNNDNATQSHFEEMYRRMQTLQIARNNQPPNVYGRHQTVRQKGKRIGNTNAGSENIQLRYRDGIRHKRCDMIIKNGKRQMMEGLELPNQEKIKTLGEKETYKYLGILEADTIKQAEIKEKIKKEYLRRTRKLLETKLHNRNLIKGINTLCKILRIFRKADERRT